MSEETEHLHRMKDEERKEERLVEMEKTIREIYDILAGDLKGKPGIVQIVTQHEYIINNEKSGISIRLSSIETRIIRYAGWIGGAMFVGMVVAWIFEHIILK